MKKATVFLTTILILLFSCKKLEPDSLSPQLPQSKQISVNKNESDKYPTAIIDGDVYVRFKNGYNPSVVLSVGGRMEKHIRQKGMKSDNPGYYKIKVTKGDERKIADALSKNPNVEWATVANRVETFQSGQPNDPMWNPPIPSLWDMTSMGADQAWASGNHGDSNNIVVVMDEGVFPHDDLCSNIYVSPFEPVDGIDNDGNGYVDDYSGWDAMHNDNQVYDGNDVHATMVGSKVCAKTNNGLGMPGIAWNAKILSLKFLEQSGSDFDAIGLFYYAIDFKQRHNVRLRTINCSWGGGGFNPALLEAIQACRDADILVNCAAGNWATDNDIQPTYPSNYSLYSDNVISVGAIQAGNTPAFFSCWGKTSVTLFAPGSGVRVCRPGPNFSSTYADVGGTSLSTPCLTGAELLYFSLHPNATYMECKQAILNSVIPVPALANLCTTGGILNVNAPAFKGVVGTNQTYGACRINFQVDSDAPQIHGDPVLAEQGFGWIRLTCPPATDTLNNSIGHYNSGVREYDWIFDENFSAETISGGPSLTVGITNGVHTVRYRVLDNWTHPSAWSNAVSVQAIIDTTPPSTPEPMTVFPSNLDSIICIWNQSFDNSTIPPDYRIHYRIVGASVWKVKNFGAGYFSGTLPDLPGGLYELYGTAIDFVGNESVPPQQYHQVELLGNENGGGDTLPPQDTIPPSINPLHAVDSTLNSITVGAIPSSDFFGVVGYRFYYRKQGTFTFVVGTSAASQFTANGLDSSSVYEFKHEAFDAAGNISSQSTLLAVHTLSPAPPPPPGDEAPPSNPTNLVATPQNWQQIKLSWTASTDNVAVAYYIVYRDGVQVGTTTSTNYTDNGLQQLTTYTYKIKAVDTSNNTSGFSNEDSATTKKKGKKN